MDNPLETIAELKKKGHPVAFVGDVVGTGSSRKSGINSVQWHFGKDIEGIPNKRTGGIIIGGIIAPIFLIQLKIVVLYQLKLQLIILRWEMLLLLSLMRVK